MTTIFDLFPRWATLLATLALAACGQDHDHEASAPNDDAASALASTGNEAPTIDELARASFTGILDEEVLLAEGTWEGEPFVEGAAAAPRVGLVERLYLTGDLTGDGRQEAAVLLWSSSGGSGTFDYLAVSGRSGAGVVNLGTAPLGDRVQVRSGQIRDGRLELEVVQAGPEDAACCPTQLASRFWQFESGELAEGAAEITGKLSLDVLRGPEWVLTDFAWNEPAAAQPEVTVTFEADRIVGNAGCNSYFGGVEESDEMAAGLSIGALGSTRKMCAEEIMAIEDRFLRQLAGTTSFSFIAGHLALSWQTEPDAGVMIFRPRESAAPDS